MSTLRSYVLVLLAAGALLTWTIGLPSEVRADRGMAGHGHHAIRGGHMTDFVGHSLRSMLRHKKELSLSEEQTAKLKAMSTDYTKNRIREEADLKLAEVDLRNLVHDEKADLGSIEAAMKKTEAAHTTLRLDGVKTLRAAHAVLTPEQLEKWRAMRMGGYGMPHERHGVGAQPRAFNEEPGPVTQEDVQQEDEGDELMATLSHLADREG